MMKSNKAIAILLWLLALSFHTKAQNVVQVVNQVVPPYSPYLSDYTGHNNRIVLLLTNNELREPVDVSLVGTIEGDNGVRLEIPLDYRPPIPLTLNPRQTLRITGLQLADYLNEQALVVSGMDRAELFYGAGLPEGNYTLCLRAIDYATGRFLSMPQPMGCGFIQIRSLEPPVLLQPFCGDTLRADLPQNLFFNWTIPAGANPSNTEYLLRIVEMEDGIANANQAMDAAPEIAFFETVTNINTYQYSLADPSLIKGKSYAFRVTARPRGNGTIVQNTNIRYRNNGRGEACYFTFGGQSKIPDSKEEEEDKDDPISLPIDGKGVIVLNDDKDNPIDDPPPDGPDIFIDPDDADDQPLMNQFEDCDADYQAIDPGGTLIASLSPGDEITVGKFTMRLNTVQKAGQVYNGNGEVRIDFLNTWVSATFNNLRINTQYQVYGNGAQVIATTDVGDALTQESFSSNTLSQNTWLNVVQNIANPSKQVVNLNLDNSTVNLPLAINGLAGNLVFAGMVFTPTEAYAHLGVSTDFAHSIGEVPISFYKLQYFQPFGLGTSQQIALGADMSFPLSDHSRLVLNQTSQVTFGCAGVEKLDLVGEVEFDRNLILPLNNQGDVIPSPQKVTASFDLEVLDINEWQVEAEISEAITIPGLVGFNFQSSNVILDFQSSQSPAGSGRPNHWTGLYIENIDLTLPELFKINNNPITLEVNDFILDRFGFSGEVAINEDILNINQGSIGGWPFSITNFAITLENSALVSSDINGALRIPISTDQLDYELAIEASIDENNQVEFQFDVPLGQDLEVDMWFAELQLDESSKITLAYEDDEVKPRAVLNGSASFGWGSGDGPDAQNSVSQFSLPTLNFNDFTISSNNDQPVVESFVFALDGEGLQANLTGFNLGLHLPQFINQDNNLGVKFGMDISLSPGANAIGGATQFTVWGELENGQYEYDRTQLDSIGIDVDIAVAHIQGGVVIYNQHDVYGNGFRGDISAKIRGIGFGLDAALQIGKVDEFRYWYFDIFANFGAGIPLPPTIAAINGIGGGAWFNMVRESPMAETNVNDLNSKPGYSNTPGATSDAVIMTPNEQASFGFSSAVAFGIYGAQTMFNADMTFGMTFTDQGGVMEVFMNGNGYMFQEMDNRDGAVISGTVAMTIQPKLNNVDNEEQSRPNFHLTSTMNLNLLGMLEGQGTLDLYFSPDEWHIYLGKWTNEDYPEQDDSRVQISLSALNIVDIVFHSYFMAGSDIPPMPQLPLVVRQQFATDNLSVDTNGQRDEVSASNDPNNVGLPGIALGAGMHMGFDVEFLIFYMSSQMDLGFDVTLLKYKNSPCENGNGFNNWYARGQAYGYFDFLIGAELDIWIWKGKIDLVSAVAAAYVNAALPNPTYLEGEISFSASVLNGALKFDNDFEFELGEKCKSSGNGPFDFPIVAEVTPNDGQTNTNVYRTPEIVFNFPEGPFSYTEDIDGEPVERTYYYKLVTYRLDWVDAEANQGKTRELKGNAAYRADGYSASYYDQNQRLPAETSVTYTVVAQGWQKKNGSDVKVTEEDEVTTGTFTTGTLPSKIIKQHMAYGKPRYRENFFLTEEFNNGFIELKHPYDHLLDPKYWYEDKLKLGTYQGAQASGAFKFQAHFRDTKTDQVIKRALSVSPASRIRFSIPGNLKKNRVYELNLAVVFTPPVNQFALGNTKSKYTDVLINGGAKNGGFSGAQDLVFANQGGNTNNQMVIMANFNWQQNANIQQASLSNINQFTNEEPDEPEDNDIFGGAVIWANPVDKEDGVYIQRKEREILQQKKGENNIVFELFDGFHYYFKTSKYGDLQDKLSQCEVHDIKTGNFGSSVQDYHGSANIVNPDPGFLLFDNTATIITELPVIVMKSSENFDEFYALPTRINMAPNVYKDYDPVIEFATVHGGDTWYGSQFWGGGSPDKHDFYQIIDYDFSGDSWEKLTFYSDEGDPVGNYDQLDIPFPNDYYWNQLLPDTYNGSVWGKNRYKNNNNFKPFGQFDMPLLSTIGGPDIQPFYTFYSSNDHPGINFLGLPVGFRKSPLVFQEEEDDPDEPVFGGINTFQSGTNNNGPANIGQIAIIDPPAYFGVVDYAEWVAMRDHFTVKKYMYEFNEENINDNIEGCEAINNWQIGDFPGANCYYQGIRDYVLQHYFYRPRPSGGYFFSIQRFGTNGTAKTEYYYDALGLND